MGRRVGETGPVADISGAPLCVGTAGIHGCTAAGSGVAVAARGLASVILRLADRSASPTCFSAWKTAKRDVGSIECSKRVYRSLSKETRLTGSSNQGLP